jgi:pSer/pThr/pTyr-binding forkhead associated (FHA) protein
MSKYSLSLIDHNGTACSITHSRFFIGSNPECNMVIGHPSIANFHAMIYVNEDNQFFVMDLKSKNPLRVNGVSINLHQLAHDDLISIGNIQLHASITKTHTSSDLNNDNIEVLSQDTFSFVEHNLAAGFKFEDQIVDWKKLLNVHSTLDLDYKEVGLNLEANNTITDFTQKAQFLGFEVTLFCGEMILSKHYYQSQNKSYKAKKDLGLDLLGEHVLITVNGEAQYFTPDNFSAITIEAGNVVNAGQNILKNNQSLILQNGIITIIITFGYFNKTHLPQTFFEKDVAFYKQTSKVFAGLFLPVLLLIFFKPEVKEEPKEIAVIYKKISTQSAEPQMQESEKVADNSKGTGLESPDQSKQKSKEVKVAKSAERMPASATPVESTTTPTPEVAKKTFQFNGLAKLNQMVANSPKLAAVNNDNSALTGSGASNVLNKGNLNALDSVSSGVDSLGTSDISGTLKGKGGLSSKKGFDTSYIEARTVVLGSMDPELLRKILREYIPQFRHCYQKELLGNDKIKGILELNFRITGSGKVSNIDVMAKDAQFSKNGSDCMAGVLNLIEFPKPQGGGVVDIRQPLNFVSEKQRI